MALVAMARHTRRAVDQTAKDYWTSYYGKYGEMWVREIPRKIKRALLSRDDFQRAASKVDVVPLQDLKSNKTGGLELHGVMRTAAGHTIFKAEFSKSGKLVDVKKRGVNR